MKKKKGGLILAVILVGVVFLAVSAFGTPEYATRSGHEGDCGYCHNAHYFLTEAGQAYAAQGYPEGPWTYGEDTIPPTSTIYDPADGATLSGMSYTIMIGATDPDKSEPGEWVSKVEVSTDGGQTWNEADWSDWNLWVYKWTLPADGLYTIQSRAMDHAGNVETPGPGICVTVKNDTSDPGDLEPPTKPGTPRSTASGDSLNLSWTESTDNVGVECYKVERSDDQANWIEIANVVTNEHIDSGLEPGTYYYRVKAYDAAENNSEYSDVGSGTVESEPEPNPEPELGLRLSADFHLRLLGPNGLTDPLGLSNLTALLPSLLSEGTSDVLGVGSALNLSSSVDGVLPIVDDLLEDLL